MKLHINIDVFSGILASAVNLEKYPNFKPAPKNFNMEAANVTIAKPLYEKIKGTIGLGSHSPIVIEPNDFFEANFEPIEGKVYLTIENDSLKELTVKSK